MFGAEIDRLLLDARTGNPLALGKLLETVQSDLRSAAAGVFGRQPTHRLSVEEVYADALFAVAHDIRSLRATSYTGFRYWFASIARNQLRHALRRHRARREHTGEDPEPEHGQRAGVRADDQTFARGVLVRMPASQQVAYVLREGLGLAWPAIGFVIGRRAPSAARLIHYRAARRARDVAWTKPDLRLFVPAIRA